MERQVEIVDKFPAGFHRAVARVVIEFGRLEYLIKACTKDLSGKDFQAGMLEAGSIKGFMRLCSYADGDGKRRLTDDEYEALSAILDKARTMAYDRNDTVHAMWTMDNGEPLRTCPRVENGEIDWSAGGPVSVQELADLADKLKALHEELEDRRMMWSIRV